MKKFEKGDWCVFEHSIVQIKKLEVGGHATVSEGSFETSGNLGDRFRELTLRNKRTIENFDYYYRQLRTVDGESGFNYPDIFRHFVELSLRAMDGNEEDTKPYDDAKQFVEDARAYKTPIQGVALFRRRSA